MLKVFSEINAGPCVNSPSFYLILTEIKICRKCLLKKSNIKFHEDLTVSRVITSGQTDRQPGRQASRH
jgi:hypothetical protein